MKDLANKPFALLGVNSDRDLNKIRKICKEKDITWRSFWNGEKGTSGPISTTWNVRGWPTVYIIDHEGIIRHKSHGQGIDEVIQKLVAEASQR